MCGAALADQDGLCVDCWSLLDIPGEGGGEAAALWLEHGRTVPVHAATFYNEASRRLVLDYKHGRRIALAKLLARLIAARLPGPAQGGAAPLLVPVPLHCWRLWQRGFNRRRCWPASWRGSARARGWSTCRSVASARPVSAGSGGGRGSGRWRGRWGSTGIA
ncbi:MAG: ComF family protein [Erythrobacteraceae bacterium]